MHRVTLNINDNIYSHIMFLLKSLNPKDIEIIKQERVINDEENINYETWAQEEIKNIGKIGLSSKSFVEDSEDYSQW